MAQAYRRWEARTSIASQSMNEGALSCSVHRDWTISGALLLLLAVLLAISLLAGRVWLPAGAWHGMWSQDAKLAAAIVTQLVCRARVLAIEVGAAFGLSGAVLQGLTRNPLAEPGLLGVSAGAALGAVVAVYFGFAVHFAIAAPLFGLTGAVLASILTFALGRGGGTITLVLAGAAVSALAAAGIALALDLAPNPYAAYEIMTWLMGSLADRSWVQVMLVTPFIPWGLRCCCSPLAGSTRWHWARRRRKVWGSTCANLRCSRYSARRWPSVRLRR